MIPIRKPPMETSVLGGTVGFGVAGRVGPGGGSVGEGTGGDGGTAAGVEGDAGDGWNFFLLFADFIGSPGSFVPDLGGLSLAVIEAATAGGSSLLPVPGGTGALGPPGTLAPLLPLSPSLFGEGSGLGARSCSGRGG